MSRWPSISVVVPTHNRPQELRTTLRAILAQDYAGPIDVLVVHDHEGRDSTLEQAGIRPVAVMTNQRCPGLAGSRNTGILASRSDFVAFCDDDDIWQPHKLRLQVAALEEEPEAELVTCAITVKYGNRSNVRLAGHDRVTHPMLVRSRMSMLHSSTLVFRRSAMLGDLGLINEAIPGSQNEDWDILLRAAARHPIVHVDEPLVDVLWGQASYFSRRWDTKIASSIWMLEHHPHVADDPRAAARLMGQIAFAHAASGNRREAWSWSARAARQSPLQWRSPLSSVVALAPRSSETVLAALHRFGRGV